MNELSTFISKSFQNVRSSKRTEELHLAVLKYLYYNDPSLARFDVKFEYTMPDAFNGTFTVDIALFENKKLHTVVLCKALNSNINKNQKNLANTTIGEAARLCYSPTPPSKVIFVSVMPEIAPRFNRSGVVTGFDDVVKSKLNTNISNVLKQQYNNQVCTLDLWYQIPNVQSRLTQTAYESFDPIVSW